ncbi:PEP-CTERM sorting domain-containing protein [Luteolibacter algae]|uniref:PEP-CTERM sorting domain-containing protein n=1 Tax=Luteolibacter algae TaxID=454151 RepID=A0ABW5DE01_9BACT
MKKLLLNTTFASACVFSTSQAATITYVDALHGLGGNTFSTTQGAPSADNSSWLANPAFDGDSTENNTQWNGRTFNGAGGTVYQAQPAAGGSIPELTTQITGLADGTYDIWIYYTENVNNGQNWFIDAGFTSGSLTTYGAINGTTVVDASSQTFSNSTDANFSGGAAAYLGQQTVVGGSTVDVFINHPGGNGGANRTVYNGVGYELIPEPSSTALSGMTAGLLLFRRKRV